MRGAWAPMFYSAALQGFERFMIESADRLIVRLEAAAKEGSLIDLHAALQSMTLQIILLSAFGLRWAAGRASLPCLPVHSAICSAGQAATAAAHTSALCA